MWESAGLSEGAFGGVDQPGGGSQDTHIAVGAGLLVGSIPAVTLLVSHRFSTVRMADLIVVLDGGLYAELYQLQSRAYS